MSCERERSTSKPYCMRPCTTVARHLELVGGTSSPVQDRSGATAIPLLLVRPYKRALDGFRTQRGICEACTQLCSDSVTRVAAARMQSAGWGWQHSTTRSGRPPLGRGRWPCSWTPKLASIPDTMSAGSSWRCSKSNCGTRLSDHGKWQPWSNRAEPKPMATSAEAEALVTARAEAGSARAEAGSAMVVAVDPAQPMRTSE